MVTGEDFVTIKFNKERDISAEYFAMQKLLYKHPFLPANETVEPELEILKMEFLSEFAFMEYLLSLLDEKFRGMKWDISKIELAGRDALLAGIYDEKTEKTLIEKTIILKTFTKEKMEIKDIILKNFTASKLEFPKANLYVQSFVMKNQDITLAGYCKYIPSINKPADKSYHSIPISELMNMSSFINEFS